MNNFNFLPGKFKKSIKNGINVRLLYAGSIVFFLWVLIFGITIFVNTQVLNIQNRALRENLDNISGLKATAEARDLEEEINEFNRLLSRVQDIKNDDRHDIIRILEDIANSVPQGSTLNSLNFNPSNGTVFINGHADQRTQVITLQGSLEDSSLFEDVDGPLSNLLKSEDIDFQFTLQLKEQEE